MSEYAFSVVIPTRNRPQQLAACLQSFCRLAYPAGKWEIIVVDDGGDDSLTAVSHWLLDALPVRVVDVAAGGPAAARNAGAETAVFPYLAFTDDDCRVTPDWLQQLAAGFRETGADGLGGQTLNPAPHEDGMAASAWLVDFLYQHFRDAAGSGLLLVSNNAAYRVEAFWAVAGFDERYPLAAAEDMDLSRRMAQNGRVQRYWPAARVYHHHALGRWGHVRQQFRYGRGGYHFVQRQNAEAMTVGEGGTDEFYPALWRALRQSALPLRVQLLVLAGQVAYRVGQFAERVGG